MLTRTKSYTILASLAQSPIDLTQEGMLCPERVQRMQAEGAGYKLLYATQRIQEDVLEALVELSREVHAIDQMQAMQAGEIINTIEGFESDNRSVLHTAMRDLFTAKNSAPRAAQARDRAEHEMLKLKKFIRKIEEEKKIFNMVCVGIGGSELGPKALYQALPFYHNGRSVHFVGNVDPDDMALALKKIDINKTIVVVVSKSGATLETATNEEWLRNVFRKKGLDPKAHFVAVTQEGSPMDNPNQYLERFHMWDYVGGRFSSTSMVGGLPLSFGVGYDAFMEILQGAHDMDRVALCRDERVNLPLLSALIRIWNRNFLHYPTVAIVPYAQVLHRFPAHLQQCDMESNGKRINKKGDAVDFGTGAVIWGEPGTNAQHSFYQLIHQGSDIIPVELIGFHESQGQSDFTFQGTTSQEKLSANMFAQAIALAKGQKSDNPNRLFPGNRPSSLLIANRLNPYSLGALLSYYEHVVAFQGFIWGINSFDQEGVQLGKKLAEKMMSIYKARHEGKNVDFLLGEAYITHSRII